ncbi:hypothetical protein UZ36_07470 [Candidatus Nitromaritima sp. SCGC AAA799-C22]|nr:hypothetical protein UZ36_07470 [Candidatus Nitromaritima sp. SCGC AAA799-C22]
MNKKPVKWKSVFAVLLFLLLFWPVNLQAAPAGILVAAASSMKFVFEEMAEKFHRQHPGTSVKISFGSSGNFFSQIKHGAPYDIFFSADMNYPTQLAREGHGQAGHPAVTYAVGRIVLWTPSGTDLDVQKEKSKILLNPKVHKIAIANPAHAPYGKAAVEWMTRAKIYSQIKSRLVLGENISQAAQFVHSQAAQAGIIALSLALDPKMKAAGNYWEILQDQYSPIEQGFLILKNAARAGAARSFADFVTGPEGSRILKKYGFALPERGRS